MAFLGLNIKKLSGGYRSKRFKAFCVDAILVLGIIYIVFKLTGIPDFPAVQQVMEAARAGSTGPNAQQLTNEMFNLFNSAYSISLIIWFLYEVLTQLIFKGATIGKLTMGLRIVPMNSNRNWIVHNILLVVRSAVKFLFIYLFQGFPFLIACLTIFANAEGRSGFDMFVKTYVKNVKEPILYENCNKCATQE